MICSIILALHFLGIVDVTTASTALYVTGVVLLVAEIGVVSFGILAFNGLLALYAGYALQVGLAAFFGLDIGWDLFFGVALIEFASLFIGIYLWKRLKRIRNNTGTEGMIGQSAVIIEWSGKKGRVMFEGEPWKALSEKEIEAASGDEFKIIGVKKMSLIIGI